MEPGRTLATEYSASRAFIIFPGRLRWRLRWYLAVTSIIKFNPPVHFQEYFLWYFGFEKVIQEEAH